MESNHSYEQYGTKIQGITFYTVIEVAELLRCTPATVRTYIREGRLKGQRIGRPLLITEKDLMKFLQKSK